MRECTHHIGDSALCIVKSRSVAEEETHITIWVRSQILGLRVGLVAHVAALELVDHMDALEAVGDGHLNWLPSNIVHGDRLPGTSLTQKHDDVFAVTSTTKLLMLLHASNDLQWTRAG